MNKKTRFMVHAALLAAIYVVITIAFAPISYGPIQIRISEMLTVLPFFTPAAIPGLFIGALIANAYGGLGIIDVVVGSSATLIAALITFKMKRKMFAPLPPVLVNAVIIGAMLSYLFQLPLLPTMIYVGLGQVVACYGLGYPFMMAIEKYGSRWWISKKDILNSSN
ncbi:QueT transporter family protein [Tindallia californiensis]|uniref:Uncharacterized membrane protein n=1 Tax=Tindallia californiensis TaxID=159292 RepID=A0A1H3KB09_9FIRM|nr:QueT transporter family protein [Tindallia californiensis]SDY49336.1 Uncharacterized membrane protein [Tindallia californiensis]